ncbi:hypothetical protein ACJMK2_037607 [Sinanodonta woodiana]|uniref:Protein FAM98A n=1 Tax=Sinanodonta woodiana TaxID=1069815 RepID=A0ABD3WMC7_SINWO
MENDILDSLDDIGYTGPLLESEVLKKAVEEGPRSVEYTSLVSWLVKEIQGLTFTDESVNPITGPDDATHFLMELSGFLREYGCPYQILTDGPISQRLNTQQSKLQLLDYLTTELSALRIIAVEKPSSLKPASSETTDVPQQLESDTAKHLKMMLIALGFPKPPATITPFQLCSKVEAKVKELMGQHPNQIGKPLLKARLSEKQWEQIMKINQALVDEYRTRRDLLLKRLDVTVQSFMWSDKAKEKENKIAEVYQPIRRALSQVPEVGIPQILSARDDLTRILKTSSGKEREVTKCAINRVIIPKVPDRGGRAWELEPPPPEMPSFQKRQDSGFQQQRPQSARGGGRGGGGDRDGGGRGGKVQGSWSDMAPNTGGHWAQGGGGYGRRGGSAGRRGGY